METKTTKAISSYSDRYGDKLVELMDRCGADNLRKVPEAVALQFLDELKGTKKHDKVK